MTDLSAEQTAELEMLRAIVENTPDAIYVATESGYYLDVYGGNERAFDMDSTAIVGRHYTETHSPRFCQIISKTINDALAQNCTQCIRYSLRLDEVNFITNQDLPECDYWFEARVTPISLPHFNQRVILWNARDITKRVQLEQEVRLLVDYDELTGIFSRRRLMIYLSEYFEKYLRYKNDISVIMLDIDNFKRCNDELGHLNGDKIIAHVAQVCRAELRASDIFGRLGGEEFAVILPNTPVKQASLLAERS